MRAQSVAVVGAGIAVTLALAAAGAGAHEAAPPPADPLAAGPALTGFHAALRDSQRRLGGGRLRLSTQWTLCWQPVPGAQRYEVQLLTSEGVSRDLKQVAASAHPCWGLQVAAVEAPPAQLAARRAEQLALSGSMLAARVRAVAADGTQGAWSVPFAAGALPADDPH